ncbi:hypothetical protein GCM10027049_26430 [Mucilaginibacter puniceus]
MKQFITAILLVCVFAACSNKAEETPQVMNALLEAPPTEYDKSESKVAAVRFPPPVVKTDAEMAAEESVNPIKPVEKKLIREGSISFETSNILETKKAINASLAKLGGYVETESESNGSDSERKEYKVFARVPAKNFEVFLNGVSTGADKIDSKNINVRDVTANFIDMTTRLANKKKLEQRYLEILKKSNKVSDLLEVEENLNQIREDIESTQNQLNYLVKDIDYSTLDITFYSKQTVNDTGVSFGYKIKSAFGNGWNTLESIFFGIIGLWPIWLILFMLIYAIRKWRKSRKAKI